MALNHVCVCVGAGKDQNASQFYITTGSNLDSLDDKHTIFGQVAEGWDVLDAINDMPCDEDGRPLQNVRYVDDPCACTLSSSSDHDANDMFTWIYVCVCGVGYDILLCWMTRHQPWQVWRI